MVMECMKMLMKIVVDDARIEMMQGYIDYMFKAMEDGCDVRGYYA